MKRKATTSKVHWLFAMGFIIVAASVWFLIWNKRGHGSKFTIATNSLPAFAAPTNAALAAVGALAATNAANFKQTARLPVPTFSWFRPHPFPVSKSSGAFEWTAEDGKDTNVIRQLAHNELEYQRMVAENATIFRRQLVYHPEGFTLQAQQAVRSGQSIQQLTLPGLDGQALEAVVTRADLREGGSQGQFYGQLPGRPDSMVTVAFVNDREAFTVISPQDQLYLQAEAREPGEIVVKRINPGTYGMLQP
jgi:hypothetical protein